MGSNINMIYRLWYSFECTIPAKAIRTISEPLLLTWLFRLTTKQTRVWESNFPKLLDILDIYYMDADCFVSITPRILFYGYMQHYVNL